ncbi:hypothetical protein HY312_04000 [Candidatus Saccharibacteria bacterium]|nr:hypothetical protein [Candidatus Saccharibacteria bacterium]
MDIIELWSGSTKALVSIDGGWLTNVSDDYGDILFPKRQLTTEDGSKKQRGGCHICLPNFGPGGLSDQVQHGFGRQVIWEVGHKTQSEVTLELPHGDEEYPDLSSQLTYALDGNSIKMTLKVINNGSDSLRIAPGFHPYFATIDGEGQVSIDGERTDIQDLEDTVFHSGNDKTLKLDKRMITMHSDELTTWAAWSDHLGNYVCLEPTYAGYAFEDADDAPDDQLLHPDESRVYSVSITW